MEKSEICKCRKNQNEFDIIVIVLFIIILFYLYELFNKEGFFKLFFFSLTN